MKHSGNHIAGNRTTGNYLRKVDLLTALGATALGLAACGAAGVDGTYVTETTDAGLRSAFELTIDSDADTASMVVESAGQSATVNGTLNEDEQTITWNDNTVGGNSGPLGYLTDPAGAAFSDHLAGLMDTSSPYELSGDVLIFEGQDMERVGD